MAEPRRKSVHALLHMQSWCSVQVNSFVGIKKNINFSEKDFLKGKVVACFYTILSKFGNKLRWTASMSFIGHSVASLSSVGGPVSNCFSKISM